MGKVKQHTPKNRGSRNTKKLPNAGEAARQAAMLQRLRNVVSAAHSTDTEKLELQAALLGGHSHMRCWSVSSEKVTIDFEEEEHTWRRGITREKYITLSSTQQGLNYDSCLVISELIYM